MSKITDEIMCKFVSKIGYVFDFVVLGDHVNNTAISDIQIMMDEGYITDVRTHKLDSNHYLFNPTMKLLEYIEFMKL